MPDEVMNIEEPQDATMAVEPEDAETASTPEPETHGTPAGSAAPPTSGGQVGGGGATVDPPASLMAMLSGRGSDQEPVPPMRYPGSPPQDQIPHGRPPGDGLPPAPSADMWMTQPDVAAQMLERRTEAMVAARVANLADMTTRNSEEIRSDRMRREAEARAAVEMERMKADQSITSHFRNIFSKDPHYMGDPRVKAFVDQSMHLMAQRAIRAGQAGDPTGFMQINNPVAAKGLLALAYAAYDIPLGNAHRTVQIAGAQAVQGKRKAEPSIKLDPEEVAYAAAMGISEDELMAAKLEEMGA